MDKLTRQLQNLLARADAARQAGENTDKFRVMVANWQLGGASLDQIVNTVADVTKEVVGDRKLTCDEADFTARQIVDDCWRAGVDVQFQQHIIEGVLWGLNK